MLLGIMIAWASFELGFSSFAIGAMFACYWLGMIIGASFMRRNGSRMSQEFLLRFGPYCGFTFAVLIGLTAITPLPALLYLAFFVIGVGPIVWTITTIGIRQAVTPHHLIGRVSATNMTLSAGARPLGAALGYLLFEIGGYPMVFGMAMIAFGWRAIAIGRTSLAREPAPVAIA